MGCSTELGEGKGDTVPEVENVKEAYGKAIEAFAWFEISTMPLESSAREIDGRIYNKVKHDTIKTYADLEMYLHSLFSEDIVREKLNKSNKLYRDIEGALYGMSADRGTDLYKGDATLEVRQESDEKFICVVEVELLREDYEVIGYETHKFSYELIDGKWVFTNFYLFY